MTLASRAPRIEKIMIPPGWGRTSCLVLIPAKNEADRIRACLTKLAGQGVDVLVVANNCSDATGDLAAVAGAAVINCTLPEGGVGAARRLGADEGLRRMPSARSLLTSDADCLVAPDWVAANCGYLEKGAAAVCGFVQPIPEEHAALPPALLRRAALEDRFLGLKARLEAHLTGQASHEQTPGASLAFTPATYRAVGGFDPLPTHEDRAIITRLKVLGLPVVHARDVTVQASCRMQGRAPGGMAAALKARSIDPDAPLCSDMGQSGVPAVAAVLATLGALNHQSQLPAAISTLQGLLDQAKAL